MPWLQLRLDLLPTQAEEASDLLLELGAAAITFQDAADQPLFEPTLGKTELWDATRLIALFDSAAEVELVVAALRNKIDTRTIQNIHIDPLEDQPWERTWMEHFHPIRFGQHLWVCPSWREPVDPEAVNILLDPGLAFGTGTHPTTTLCLEWLDKNPPNEKNVIDYGCGSGILSIAAALLGATHINAIDHDQQALLASRNNAEKNAVSQQIRTFLPHQFETSQANLLLANILANPLIELAPRFAKSLTPGGQIVLSGILADQAESVAEAYRPWFTLSATIQKESWVLIEGQRRLY